MDKSRSFCTNQLSTNELYCAVQKFPRWVGTGWWRYILLYSAQNWWIDSFVWQKEFTISLSMLCKLRKYQITFYFIKCFFQIGPDWPCRIFTYFLIIVPTILFLVNIAQEWGAPVIVVGVFLLVVTLMWVVDSWSSFFKWIIVD